MVQIYYGDGKGKTTAAMGSAVRAAGAGLKVLIVQFLKDGSSSERQVLQHIDNITMLPCPKHIKFTNSMTAEEKQQAMAQMKELFAQTKAATSNYDMVIADEVFSLVDTEFIEPIEIASLVYGTPKSCELILTGHSVSDSMLKLADYVSQIKKVRHPYDNGINARKGIEY